MIFGETTGGGGATGTTTKRGRYSGTRSLCAPRCPRGGLLAAPKPGGAPGPGAAFIADGETEARARRVSGALPGPPRSRPVVSRQSRAEG